MNTKRWSAVFLMVFLAASCANITINVYFPAESIQNAADLIEDEIRGEVLEQEGVETEASEPQAKAKFHFEWGLDFGTPAYADDVDLNINTPEIQKITGLRKARFGKIDGNLTKGTIGEGNAGYVKERDVKGVPLKDLAALRKLIKAENADRLKLYQGIARANEIEQDKVADIGKNFAKRIRGKLRVGQFYQDDAGKWVAKQPEKK